MKKALTLAVLLIVILGAFYLWVKKNPPSLLDIPEFIPYTFISENCSSNSGEEICRVVVQSDKNYVSFKLEGRYKDLLKPNFNLSKDSNCIRALRFNDERQVDYSCLEYFEEAKSP